MQRNPVGWFEIYVDDLARATKFYETVLGIKLQELPSPMEHLKMMAFPMSMESPGAARSLCRMEGVKCGGGVAGTIVYFSCTDCSVEASRIEAAGGKVQMPKSPIGQYGFHPQHTERLADYWAESLGGPKEFTDAMGSESQVVRMHSGNGEHQEMDERARTCFAQALDDADIPEERRLMARLSYADVSTSEQISEHNLVEVMSKCFADLASL